MKSSKYYSPEIEIVDFGTDYIITELDSSDPNSIVTPIDDDIPEEP